MTSQGQEAIRGCLVSIAVLVALGVLGYFVLEHEFHRVAPEEKEVEAWITRKGGGSIEERRGRHIISVSLRDKNLGDDELEQLQGLKYLKELDLSGSSITDKAISHLCKLKTLTSLDLSRTRISDAALHQLAKCGGLPNLERLDVAYTNVSEDGIGILTEAGFPKIRMIGTTPPNTETIRVLIRK